MTKVRRPTRWHRRRRVGFTTASRLARRQGPRRDCSFIKFCWTHACGSFNLVCHLLLLLLEVFKQLLGFGSRLHAHVGEEICTPASPVVAATSALDPVVVVVGRDPASAEAPRTPRLSRPPLPHHPFKLASLVDYGLMHDISQL